MAAPPCFEPMAEDALMLRFGDRMDSELNLRVLQVAAVVQRRFPQLECVPAYASVLLRFDPRQWPGDGGPHRQLQHSVEAVMARAEAAAFDAREVIVPVCYGGDCGEDLDTVAAHCRLDAATVIDLHVAAPYRVAMLGFAPGFPYLLGLDPRLSVPRRADPRRQVPQGSVAIGGGQTGIYPAALPGGWHLIGRTPLRLFDVAATPPSRFAAGDRVRFRAIDAQTFRELSA